MKKILKWSTACGVAFLLAACGGNPHNLTGKISLDRDSLIVQVLPIPRENNSSMMDTVVLRNGCFEVQLPDSVVAFVYLIPKPKSNHEMMGIYPSRVLHVPGDRLHVEGTLDSLVVSSPGLYDAYNRTEFAALERRRNQLKREMQGLAVDYAANRERLESLRGEVKRMDAELSKVGVECVKSEPENPANGLIILQIGYEEALEAARHLGDGVRNGRMKPALDYHLGWCEAYVKKCMNWERLQEGVTAPDFSLPDVRGGEKSLSDFRGRYVVLDFWGTWCGWCVKEIPELQKYYGKYRAKVEFVSIDCGDKLEKVRKFIDAHGMTWTNLFNGDATEVTSAYGVSAYPTKVIIDPEGKVVAKYLGESRAFYEKLEQLCR